MFMYENAMKRTLLSYKFWRVFYKREKYSQFIMKKVTLVQKIPRYDYERCLHPDMSEDDLQKMVKFITSVVH